MLDGQKLAFEEWCTVSTRVFGSQSINDIGDKIKDFNNNGKNNFKIIDNSIDTLVFFKMCMQHYTSHKD